MITLSEQLQIPFYNSEGEHLITLPIEPHDDRRPPGMAELVGPDATGAVMRHYYELRPDARGGSGVALRRGPPGTAGTSAAGQRRGTPPDTRLAPLAHTLNPTCQARPHLVVTGWESATGVSRSPSAASAVRDRGVAHVAWGNGKLNREYPSGSPWERSGHEWSPHRDERRFHRDVAVTTQAERV